MKDLQFSPGGSPTNCLAPFFGITTNDLQRRKGAVKALRGPQTSSDFSEIRIKSPPTNNKNTQISKQRETHTRKKEKQEINGPLSRAENPPLWQINQDMFISCSGKQGCSITWMLMLQPCNEIFKHTAGIRLRVHRLPGPAVAGAMHAELSASSKTIYLERVSINTRHCPLVFTIHPLSPIQDKCAKAASSRKQVHTPLIADI